MTGAPTRPCATGRPRYNRTIQQVHVHHTVNSNDYRRADVPALLRGMYRYHTQNLGWSDIGYNFLVDRFGRTWPGRAGGAGRPSTAPTRSASTARSTGVAVIGNFETGRPDAKVLTALVHLAAVEARPVRPRPVGQLRVRSTGSDRYPAGRKVRLPVIDGHRDTNETACPGINLYRRLPDIRARTARSGSSQLAWAGLARADRPALLPPLKSCRGEAVDAATAGAPGAGRRPGALLHESGTRSPPARSTGWSWCTPRSRRPACG